MATKECLPSIWSALKTQSSTRLLTILPGLPNDSICCRLTEVDLQDYPKYEALSYTWGSASNQEIIDVNGAQVQIRSGLYGFLQKLRHPCEERVFWVDALCISQIDLDEKAQQVAKIGRIFKQAICVRVWVGEHADNSQTLFTGDAPIQKEFISNIRIFVLLLRRLRHLLFWLCLTAALLMGILVGGVVSRFKGLRVGGPVGSGIFAFYTLLSATRLMFGEPLTQRELSFRTPEWRAFIDRPYWRRTWIVQEIALARSVSVHCGPDAMGWSDLIGTRIEYTGLEFSEIASSLSMPNHRNRPTDEEVVFLNALRQNLAYGPRSLVDLYLCD